MKKLIVFTSFVFAAAFLISSCKKDFTCDCTYEDIIGEPGTLSWEIKDQKKKDAEEACESYSFEGWAETNCTLK